MDDRGEYILNGYNVIHQYPINVHYGGLTFEYTGTNSTLERVNTTFARRLKRDLTVEVSFSHFNQMNQNKSYHSNLLVFEPF